MANLSKEDVGIALLTVAVALLFGLGLYSHVVSKNRCDSIGGDYIVIDLGRGVCLNKGVKL